MDDELDIEGYKFCSCGSWIADYLVRCAECAQKDEKSTAESVIVEIEGYPVKIGPHPRPKQKRKPKSPITPRGIRDRARDRARQRALFRLAAIYDDMFSMLFIEEQIREGVEPSPKCRSKTYTSAVVEGLLSELDDFRENLASDRFGVTCNEQGTYPDDERLA